MFEYRGRTFWHFRVCRFFSAFFLCVSTLSLRKPSMMW